jgi:hypothetical protein
MPVRETIYLVINRRGVERMTKRLPELKRGEIPVKLTVSVADTAFREPVIERDVEIVDWRDGLEISDVELRESFITEEEAAVIRQRRLAKMRELLEQNGFTVTPSEQEEEDEDAAEADGSG